MSTKINWPKLVQQGRAKAVGIPWSDEEANAIHKLGMKAEDVRNGFLTPKELKEGKAKSEKSKDGGPLEEMSKEDLAKKAKERGLEFNIDIVGRGDLVLEIMKAEKKVKEKKKEMAEGMKEKEEYSGEPDADQSSSNAGPTQEA